MVDVGGRKLHLECDGSGSPTVILEAGLTGDHRTWDQILPEVASTTRVCAYDRANIDPSDQAPTPRTARDIVADLHALVGAGKLEGPYVLVGFSFGGLVSQLYASTFPDDIAGMVLVESNHPDEVDQFEAELTPAQITRDRQEANANPEGVDLYASFKQVQAAPGLPDRPLVVITAGKPEGWPPGWDAEVFNRLRADQQKDLVGRVSDGTQVIAKQSAHQIPASDPEIIVKGIKTVLAKAD
jgi:pimeloyl-ACP methyl ester carboxylesterase